MPEDVERHCAEIDRCNQRGGRMLSIVDLIDAGTFSRGLAAYALAAVSRGASFLVGANPGGAGKTTAMGALLNFVPADVELAAAGDGAAIQDGLAHPAPRRCYVCHEIGRGHWFAYLWGRELRDYFELPTAGHMLATNLHADTLDEAREQIVRQNGVPEATFRRMTLAFFLHLRWGGLRRERRIVRAWETDGGGPHRDVIDDLSGSRLVPADRLDRARAVIDEIMESGARTIRDVRRAVLVRHDTLNGGNMTEDSRQERVDRIIEEIMAAFDLERPAARTQLHKYVCGGSCDWFTSREPPERHKLDLEKQERARIDQIVGEVLPDLSADGARRAIHAVLCHPLPE